MQTEFEPSMVGQPAPRTSPASPGQERLWLIAESEGSTAAYAVPVGYRLAARLERATFRNAIGALIARHDALRTSLSWQDGRVMQSVHPSVETEPIWAEGGLDGFELALRRAATESFDLSRPPLVRFVFAELPGDETAFGLVFHHSICDSWAIELLLHNLADLLEGRAPAREAGRHERWSHEEHAWLASPEAERARDYWRRQLDGGVAPLELARGARRNPRRGEVHRFRIGTPPVDQLVRETVATRFSILLAAYAALLRRYSLHERHLVGLPLAGRSSPEAEQTVGYLSNTIVAVEAFSEKTTFRQAIQSALTHVVDGLEHGRLPFQEIVKLAARRDGNAPLYQALFGPQDTIDEAKQILGAPLVRLRAHNGTAKCDLTLLVETRDDWIDCELEYDCDLFDAAWAQGFCAAYERLIQAAAAAPDARVDELSLLDPAVAAGAFAERAGARDYLDESPAHIHVEAQARITPDALAVQSAAGSLSYRQVDQRANAIARRLLTAGARPRVGILLERGADLVCALLGTFKAGGAFVPLDGRFPRARLATICADAGIAMIITNDQLAPAVAGIAPLVIPDGRQEPRPPDVEVSPRDLAFIYYTSGSTGRPKGVPVDHRCAMVRLAYLREAYPLEPGEAVLHKTPLIFDIALWEIFLPLFAGGAIVVADPGRESDGAHLADLLRREPIVLCHFVPSAVGAFLDSIAPRTYPRLRWVIVSGEAAPVELVRRARAHFGVPVHSQYGQTETSEVTVWDGEGEARPGAALLGKPVGAYSLYVVDRALQPVPTDLPGELCVAAPGGLAWGYLNRPDWTAQRFIPHPDGARPGERLYLTGDLARHTRSGLLEYLGRADQQLKIRGCRVEPGEIENVLQAHAGVVGCAVVARRVEGELQLVAYFLGNDPPPSPAALEQHARGALPWYMIPSAYVLLDSFPRTLSGKIDRDRLPPPERRAFAVQADTLERPLGPLEETVAAEWARVLGRTELGRGDDFFRLGGSSLGAIRVLAALGNRFGIKLKIADFTRRPTISGLAGSIEQGIEQIVSELSELEVNQLMQTMRAHEPSA